MNDYTYPSVYLAYLLFTVLAGLTVYFFILSLKDGYWGKHSEDAKYHVFEDDQAGGPHGSH